MGTRKTKQELSVGELRVVIAKALGKALETNAHETKDHQAILWKSWAFPCSRWKPRQRENVFPRMSSRTSYWIGRWLKKINLLLTFTWDLLCATQFEQNIFRAFPTNFSTKSKVFEAKVALSGFFFNSHAKVVFFFRATFCFVVFCFLNVIMSLSFIVNNTN